MRKTRSGRLRVALVAAADPARAPALCKDLNGGLGTADDFGRVSAWAGFIAWLRRTSVRMPVVSFAYVNALLRAQGHVTRYYEGELPRPDEDFDLILVYGSIVDFRYENAACAVLKARFPAARVGVFGPFPGRFPEHFPAADFVLSGEAESFFAAESVALDELEGVVPVGAPADMDALPTPDFRGFPVGSYRYRPALAKTPFLPLLASKGCPYSCRAYCTYGEYQGARARVRSPERVVADLRALQKRHGVRAVQFRDPTFGLAKGYMPELAERLLAAGVRVDWGIETRTDLLTPELIALLSRAGLRNLNIGVETASAAVAGKSRRVLVSRPHQEVIVDACRQHGVNVSAFYILGQEADTEATMRETIDYALRLDTPLARFSVFTPYPGTSRYAAMAGRGEIVETDLERFTQFNLVYAHQQLSPAQVDRWLATAIRRYYLRPSFLVASAWRHYGERLRGLGHGLGREVSEGLSAFAGLGAKALPEDDSAA